MKRRKKIRILPINRCLLFRKNKASGKDGQGSLAEKLGLKPSAEDRQPVVISKQPVDWVHAPRFPVWKSEDLKCQMFIMATRHSHPVSFRYHGGSMPGAMRSIYPAGVYTVGRGDSLYISGWCMNTESNRTFRLDRIELIIKN